MNSSKKLIFFGNERLATGVSTDCPVIRSLIREGYEIAAVVSSFNPGQSRNSRELQIGQIAKEHRIPLLLSEKLAEAAEKIAAFGAEAAVLVAYGKIIPSGIIGIFPKGIINIHPSLLPLYRGPTPIETAILDGAAETGVSLMKLAPKMDGGPIFAQTAVKLTGNETKQALADKLLNLGAKALIEELPGILDGSKKAMSQNDALATYTKLIHKDDGVVDFKKPAQLLEREVRAYAGWPKSRAKIFSQTVIITKARVASNETDGDLVMRCGTCLPAGRQGYLEILELIAPSGRAMSGKDFLHGYKK